MTSTGDLEVHTRKRREPILSEVHLALRKNMIEGRWTRETLQGDHKFSPTNVDYCQDFISFMSAIVLA